MAEVPNIPHSSCTTSLWTPETSYRSDSGNERKRGTKRRGNSYDYGFTARNKMTEAVDIFLPSGSSNIELESVKENWGEETEGYEKKR